MCDRRRVKGGTITARHFYRPAPEATGSDSGIPAVYVVALWVACCGPLGYFLFRALWVWISQRRRALRRPAGPENLPLVYLDNLSLPDLVRYTLEAVLDRYEDQAARILGPTRGRPGCLDPSRRARLRRKRMDGGIRAAGSGEGSS